MTEQSRHRLGWELFRCERWGPRGSRLHGMALLLSHFLRPGPACFFQDAGQLAEWKEAFNLFDKDKVKHAKLAL